ncbi:polyribonucleotide nucleotidyltransferase 1, mitochondrial-like [Tubulanus polymorphus]|uniref:polyribonucleotide nucleotidyltransferase 1, mitochondrial-like n=1 Tax=Tubulanus polymorphus TaxID=672921 RepID=UPI003DA4D0B2
MNIPTICRLVRSKRHVICQNTSYSKHFYCQSAWKTRHEAQVAVNTGNQEMHISCGKLARMADGGSIVQLGHTSVMVAVVSKSTKSSAAGFLPLTVDYRQKAAAAGRIPTNYLRRELGQSDREILSGRMIDRSIRPLFPKGYLYETQVMCNQLAVDGINDPDVLAINAASVALAMSDIPWNGPIGAVRVGLVDGELLINPTRKQLSKSRLNLVLAASDDDNIVMLDSSADILDESDFIAALKLGVKYTKNIIDTIKDLQTKNGKSKRTYIKMANMDEEVLKITKSLAGLQIKEVFCNYSHDKFSRDRAIADIKQSVSEKLRENYPMVDTSYAFDHICKDVFRSLVFETDMRCDGRKFTDLRHISCAVDLYKPLHGSALFQRGQTQVLSTTTFDSVDSAFKSDTVSLVTGASREKNFMLHYEFPPYATNETGRLGGMGRRELGHGALAEKGLRPVVPDDFPFTIRLTCEVLESNGSSSMASVCGGSLALMDAGVPLKEAVAGIAIGLMTKSDPDNESGIQNYKILTDILGIEDYMGDMDFKMAGTRNGITALQADIKLSGVPIGIMEEAIMAARVGRIKILDIMDGCLDKPRDETRSNSPVTEKIVIPIHKRARFVGLGGYNLKKLRSSTGVSVNSIDETSFDIFAPNQEALDEAKEIIDELLAEEKEPILEFGGIYSAKIVEMKDIGVMVQLHPKIQPVLVHNSQLDQKKVNHPSALGFEVGQEISVKYFGRDPASGKIRLSRKVLFSSASKTIKALGKKPGS